jgi:hypothetical protein
MKATQYRGHCQCCGNQQAVVGPFMSKHGYTVKYGWFMGVCGGDRQVPIEVSRDYTDKIIADIRAEIPKLLAQADDVKAGKILPATAKVGHFSKAQEVPFEEASAWDQRQAVSKLEWSLRNRASAGEDFIDAMLDIAEKYHGQPLVEVAKKEAPRQIQTGEKAIFNGRVVVCKKVDGARVYYKEESAVNKSYFSWVSTTKWRGLESA